VTLGSVLRRRRFWGASPRDALPCLSKVPLDFAPQPHAARPFADHDHARDLKSLASSSGSPPGEAVPYAAAGAGWCRLGTGPAVAEEPTAALVSLHVADGALCAGRERARFERSRGVAGERPKRAVVEYARASKAGTLCSAAARMPHGARLEPIPESIMRAADAHPGGREGAA